MTALAERRDAARAAEVAAVRGFAGILARTRKKDASQIH
jgi:hypothetical protein